jgi:poly(3-hydroxybutyrate) depolymerase
VTKGKTPKFRRLKGVEDLIQAWVKQNGYEDKLKTETLSQVGDEMKAPRKTHGGGKDGAGVILVVIEEGGHTWPGVIILPRRASSINRRAA